MLSAHLCDHRDVKSIGIMVFRDVVELIVVKCFSREILEMGNAGFEVREMVTLAVRLA